ncbi:MAG: glycosyltransferase family 4 protein [Candidatus Eisenbacteria bacterium]|nr:glycosyltransferase family 4 protein [Candidatus Eisenbacteria bacterium]
MSAPGSAGGAGARRVAFYTDAQAWPGGAEMYLTGLMRWLRSAGWEPCLFASDRAETGEWRAMLGAEGFAVTAFRPTRELDARGAAEAARMLEGFPLVHFNKTHPRTCLPAIGAARRAGARVVVSTEHVTGRIRSRYPLGSAVAAALTRAANRSLDRIIVVSEASRREYARNFRCAPEQLVAIRGGVDPGRFERLPDRGAARRGLGIAPDATVVVTVGRLCEGKGQDAAVEAVALARGRIEGLMLLLVGDGPARGRLEALARERGVSDRVVFAGARGDIETVLASADAMILSSEAESLPLSVLEAMAAGLPVVSTDVGGISEAVVDRVTGRVVPRRDPDALADATAEVLGRPDHGAALGRAGRARVEAEFDVRQSYAKTAALYADLLAAAEARGA